LEREITDMKNIKYFSKKIILLILFFSLLSPLCAENKTAEEKESESTIPQGILDFRRFEIITLGALPFITLDVTLGYSLYQFVDNRFIKGNTNYAFPNPFKAGEAYNNDEMKAIIITSLGICIGIGLNDLIFNIIKRNKLKKQSSQGEINISSIEDDPDAIKLNIPNQRDKNEALADEAQAEEASYEENINQEDSEVIFLDTEE